MTPEQIQMLIAALSAMAPTPAVNPNDKGMAGGNNELKGGDNDGDSDDVAGTSTSSQSGDTDNKSESTGGDEANTQQTEEKPLNANGEKEETEQIEPQTNGKITDNVPGVHSEFAQPADGTEVAGTEQVLEQNVDSRIGTIANELAAFKMEMDKMKVQMAEILTRIQLVTEVTDNIVSPLSMGHDEMLENSIKLLV